MTLESSLAVLVMALYHIMCTSGTHKGHCTYKLIFHLLYLYHYFFLLAFFSLGCLFVNIVEIPKQMREVWFVSAWPRENFYLASEATELKVNAAFILESKPRVK